MKLLVSVRDEDEALLALRAGVDFIDLKEPRAGALGGLPVATIARIVRRLRGEGCALPISATIGDVPMHEAARIEAAVDAVAACGVDYVKVGIERDGGAAVLSMLARCGSRVVPVFIADSGLDEALVSQATGFPALMADTADKRAGSLFDCCAPDALQRFVAHVRRRGQLVGLAGALRLQHLPALMSLRPDFAGFRSAVCEGERGGPLSEERVRELTSILSGSVGLAGHAC